MSFTLSSQAYSKSQLVSFCNSKLPTLPFNSSEYHLYRFIQDFISENPVIAVKTSGSTGKPKEIELSKDAMIKSAKLTGQFLNLKRGDRALLCLPVDFIAGKMMVVRAFVLGLDLIPVPPALNPLKEIDKTFSFAAMTPMQVHNILECEGGYEKLNKIENLIIGGGDISKGLLQKIQKLKNKVFHSYGMTETITHVAMKHLNSSKPDKYFKALKMISFDTDERGCLVITAPHICTEEIVTNDIVELHGETSFEFKGRIDNTINTGGIKVFPEIIEKKLSGYINERFLIAAIPDENLGQKVVLIIESNKNEINKGVFSKANLLKYETPKDIFFLKKFNETGNGKIDRKGVVRKLINF